MFTGALVAAVAVAVVSAGTPASARAAEVDVSTSMGMNQTFVPGEETVALFRTHWTGPQPPSFTIAVKLPAAAQVTRTVVINGRPDNGTTTQRTENGITTVTFTFTAATAVFVYFVVPAGGPAEVPVTGTISSPEYDPDLTNNSVSQTIRRATAA